MALYLRYRLIGDLTQGMDMSVRRLSRVNMVIATLSSLGLSVVANFQVH